MTKIALAAHMKGMTLKSALRRMNRQRDRGGSLLEIMLGMFVGIIILGGAALFFNSVIQNNAAAASLQDKNTSINTALNRASQDVQFATTILVAAPNELVTSKEEGGKQIINRWVKSGKNLYQQTWTGPTNAYPFGGSADWIPVTKSGANAPNGDGKQVTRTSVTELKGDLTKVFTYFNADSTTIATTDAAPLTAATGATGGIKRVEMHLRAETLRDGLVENSTATAPRNTSGGGAGSGALPQNVCPVISINQSIPGSPAVMWTIVPGATDYLIHRNGILVETAKVATGKTTGTWTDPTAAAMTPGVGVTYNVYAKIVAGTSIGCRPAVYYPPLQDPSWTASTVTPASSWNGSALTGPRVTLSWKPVIGAEKYELTYREVNTSTGSAGTTPFIAVPGYNGTSTSFNWDGGGWSKRYEWKIKATALTAPSSSSKTIHTLTHPSAVGTPAIQAKYGTGAALKTTGNNVLTWKVSPTATGYDVYKYTTGNSGTAGKVGTTTALTFTHPSAYGTTHSYYVIPTNNGPRGVTATGVTVTEVRSGATPESLATSKAGKLTQLQYPPIPQIDTTSTDLNGSNSIKWLAAATAKGYHVDRAVSGSTAVTRLTGSGTTARAYNNPAGAGTQFDYYVKSYNATGDSAAASDKIRLTQRPAKPALKLSAAPSPTSKKSSFTLTANGDAGNSATSKFCTVDTCKYDLLKGSTSAGIAGHPKTANVTWTTDNPSGSSITYTARSKNEAKYNGGWSDNVSVVVNTYPDDPSWNASAVTPSGANAASWTSSTLKTPRATMAWKSVSGATKYELLYREVNAATGAAGTAKFVAAPGYNGSATSFTWDGGGWGKRYEWIVKAVTSASLASDSKAIHTLTHPAAVGKPQVKATYGTGTAKKTTGNNVLTWRASPTATGYDVYRYNSGNSGSATKIGSTTTAVTYTDPSTYGSTRSYYVVPSNKGPRGVDTKGAVLTEVRAGATQESVATSKAGKLTQLQFPPIPVVNTSSTDLDGKNAVKWNTTATATGYHVDRALPSASTSSCLTGACGTPSKGTTATTYTDNASPGTQFDYRVKAYNATGLSADFSARTRLTQRPAAPVLKVTSAPSLSKDTASFSLAANGDAGNNAANKFCGTTATACQYELFRGTTSLSKVNQPAGANATWSNAGNDPGSTNDYYARSKNAAKYNGGWSAKAKVTVKAYPGAFWVNQNLGDVKGANARRAHYDASNIVGIVNGTSNPRQNAYTTMSWGKSDGATKFDISRNSTDGATKSDWSYGLPDAWTVTSVAWSGAAGSWTTSAAPGATYTHKLTATAANGLTRTEDSMPALRTPPDLPQGGKMIIVCSGNYPSAVQVANEQRTGVRLTDFYASPRYGSWTSTNAQGLQQYQPGGVLHAGYNYNFYAPNNAPVSAVNSAGEGYFKGMTGGFDVTTRGVGGNSAVMRTSISQMATFDSGCAAPWKTGNDLIEPTYPCYGYTGGACSTANNENRPQWDTK